LAEWEIAAQYGQARHGECGRQCDEQQRLAVGPRAMGEDESIAGGTFWNMEKAANNRFAALIDKRADARLAHGILISASNSNPRLLRTFI